MYLIFKQLGQAKAPLEFGITASEVSCMPCPLVPSQMSGPTALAMLETLKATVLRTCLPVIPTAQHLGHQLGMLIAVAYEPIFWRQSSQLALAPAFVS